MNRWLTGTAAAIAGCLLAAPAPARAEPPDGWVQTRWGPLSPADKNLLTEVRVAALWQMAAGTLAEDRAGRDRIKDIGEQVRKQQSGLDFQDRRVAGQLGVPLPTRTGTEQQGWLAELRQAESGSSFDGLFVARLRQAHGRLLPVLAAGRAGTRNDLVRDFAQTAVNTVMTHMTLVETTGLVDYARLPDPAAGAADPAATGRRAAAAGRVPLSPVFVLVLLGCLAVSAVALANLARSGRRRTFGRPFGTARSGPTGRSRSLAAPSRTTTRSRSTARSRSRRRAARTTWGLGFTARWRRGRPAVADRWATITPGDTLGRVAGNHRLDSPRH